MLTSLEAARLAELTAFLTLEQESESLQPCHSSCRVWCFVSSPVVLMPCLFPAARLTIGPSSGLVTSVFREIRYVEKSLSLPMFSLSVLLMASPGKGC